MNLGQCRPQLLVSRGATGGLFAALAGRRNGMRGAWGASQARLGARVVFGVCRVGPGQCPPRTPVRVTGTHFLVLAHDGAHSTALISRSDRTYINRHPARPQPAQAGCRLHQLRGLSEVMHAVLSVSK